METCDKVPGIERVNKASKRSLVRRGLLVLESFIKWLGS